MAKLIYLTGFMGAGKTTVGELLARELGTEFLDLDRRVERDSETTISRIFADQGEGRFREMESRALRDILAETRGARAVVALGGGTLLSSENREAVLKSGILVYLEASLDCVRERTRTCPSDRPLLSLNLFELFSARQPGYETASLRISTDKNPPEWVAKEIARRLREDLR